MKKLVFLLVAFSLLHSFSIVSYETNSVVLINGDLNVHEKMVFDLDQVYNEGYRSIRPEDFGSLSSIIVHSVRLNGEDVTYETVMNGDYAEIIWKKPVLGQNIVELNYTLKDRVEVYDDFAKVCYEHYGANWPVYAENFVSTMTLPEETRGTTMHFEVYSEKKGEAYIDDLKIVIKIDDVPSGNYVGGCYLFSKEAVNTTNIVSGSAYEILQEEREIYGSENVLEYETDPGFCLGGLVLLFIPLLIFSAKNYSDSKKTRYPETIIPPEKEEPGIVSVLMRNELSKKDLMAATILKLISSNVLEIVELEKKKGVKTADLNKERTILLLKKKNAKLKGYERAIVDMLFEKGQEVDLDKMAKEFEKVKTRAKANKLNVVKQLDKFDDEIEKILKAKKVWELKNKKNYRMGILVGISMFALFFSCMFGFYAAESIEICLADGRFVEAFLLMALIIGIFVSAGYLANSFMQPKAPEKMKQKFIKWKGFMQTIKASRLKEYPPASAVIWDDIIVYATALGLTDKVKKHLSELKAFDMHKIEKIERVRTSVFVYYSSAHAVSNLSKYGSRSGRSYSSSSSGGWSSGGGGGFSGGSSGGGGFR